MSILRKSETANSKIQETTVGWFSANILKLDIFYQDIEILFDNGKPKLQTHCGVVMGLIMISIIIPFAYMKTMIMIDYQDNTIQMPNKEAYFGADFVYDAKDGWRVAFGLTGYGSELDDSPFDESIGTLEAYNYIWGE